MGIILLAVGVILLGAAVIVYMAIGAQNPGAVEGLPEGVDPEKLILLLKWGISGLLGGLGAIFTLSSLVSFGRRAKQRQLAERLMHSGIDAEATVTFVDKNFRVLVNHIPIYSIVEYTYKDSYGNDHTRRIDNVNSELVTRSGIKVGDKMTIKYAREDPGKSVMMLPSK